MIPSQFSPLERNQETGELFLRLPNSHENIILTPPRASDSAAIADIVNDPAVHPWLGRPNATFLPEDAQKLVEEFILASDRVSRSLEDANSTSVLVPTEDCPVRSIRELQADGTDVYLGNIGFKRCNWWEVQAPERDRLIAENNSRQTGDPEIVWQVSDFLASSHHRRGIMTAALATVLEKWAIPRMRVHHIHISVFTGNSGSVRVFEKNGFVLVDTLENCIEIRGEKRSLHVLDWKH
ncbi:acyl-CoA N-acyltransferase [Mycena polygramma]|nr:acyl-CoA N-acyltransferase [Mycena polygramma]